MKKCNRSLKKDDEKININASAKTAEPIAIIGMGCVVPDANNPTEYWNNILNKHSAIGEISKDRWDPDLYFSPKRDKSFHSYSKICAAVKDFKKDPLKFRIPPISAQYIDRIQFLMLEVAYQALADSGYLEKQFNRDKTAVFVGSNGTGEMGPLYNVQAHWIGFVQALKASPEFSSLPSEQQQAMIVQAEKVFKQNMPELSEDTCPGIFGSIFASRINHCFNLKGTSLMVDAACASSLAALDLAVKGLREKQFDLVLAGGVDGRLGITSYILFSSLGALSAKGSFPFDQRADGFVLGEGAGMILLKRLDEAMRDNDKIYAIIRGVGTSSDGRAKGITAPDIKGQVCALERTYAQVPFSPNTVSLIEGHGTATWAGDQVELASLNQFFKKYSNKRKSIALGSVKSMIGHLKSASGMVGIIKVAQALDHKILPPTINCEQPRKDFDWENSPLYLIDQARPWPEGSCPRRAAVDCFGFGGINYHAILEETPSKQDYAANIQNLNSAAISASAEIFVFKACSRSGLNQQLEQIKQNIAQIEFSNIKTIMPELKKNKQDFVLTIVASNSNQFRSLLDKAVIALNDSSRDEFFSMQGIYFSARPLAQTEKIAFLFPGSGAQYLDMGNDLAKHFPFVNDIFNQVDKVSQEHTNVSMLALLSSDFSDAQATIPQAEQLLSRSDYNHPAIMALESGILEVLSRCGLKPDMVAGHSLGEYVALYAAGVFDLSTVIDVTTIRGQGIVNNCFDNGAMASIGLAAEQVQLILKDVPGFIKIANKNCPAQTVVSGETAAIEYIINALSNKGIICKQLPVKSAYHTVLLEPWVKPFKELLDAVKINKPNIPIQSNLSGQVYKIDDNFSSDLPKILTQHMVEPVEFISNIEAMYAAGARLFIEVGPRSTLSSFVDNILGDKPHWTAQTNIPNRSAAEQILHCLAICIAKGADIDLSLLTVHPDIRVETLSNRGNIQAYSEESKPDLEPVDLDLKNRVVNLVALKTGYPPEVIDIDLNVESELGLDSIKQVEIIRNIADQLNIDFGMNIRSQRYKITTLRKLINLCAQLRDQSIAKIPEQEIVSKQLAGDSSADKWNTDCYRWITENAAAPLNPKIDKQKLIDKHVLLVGADQQLAQRLSKYLSAAKAQVSICLESEGMKALPDNIDIVINFSSYKKDDSIAFSQSDQWWQQFKIRAENILVLGKHLAKVLGNNPDKQIIWLEATSLGGDLTATNTSMLCAQAGLGLGLMRCLVQEFMPRLIGLCLDFDQQQSAEQFAQAVCNELQSEIKHKEIGYVNGQRFEICWKKENVCQDQTTFSLNSQSVILAIGASRGITASICHQLAKTKARIIVIGKSPVLLDRKAQIKPMLDFAQARQALLEDYKTQGKTIIPAQIDQLAWNQVWQSERIWNLQSLSNTTDVEYHQVDITDAQALDDLIKQIKAKYGKLDLVINGASGLIEKSTEDMTTEEFIDNLQVKALGTACLLKALSEITVKAFINFSSVAGRWGNKGQSSYAAGHEVAAILVSAARKQYAGRWINLFFGPWLNVGMIRVGEVVNRLKNRGSNFITEESGSNFFVQEINSPSNYNLAFCGSKSIRTFNQQENTDKLFVDFKDCQNLGKILGYAKDLFIIQSSISSIKASLGNNSPAIVQTYLSAEEYKQYAEFKYVKKRWEWLCGRLAAKAALSKYFNNDLFEPSSGSIYNLANGCPKVKINGLPEQTVVPHISLSHSQDIVLALVAQDPGIALDVQEIKASILEIADAFTSAKELKILIQASEFIQEQALTLAWAIKEAGRKAAGVELCAMQELEIKTVKMLKQYVVADAYNPNTGWIKSVAFKQNDYIIAISRVIEKENLDE